MPVTPFNPAQDRESCADLEISLIFQVGGLEKKFHHSRLYPRKT